MVFAFFTRGYIYDTIVSGWIESQESLAFMNKVFDITFAELMRKFELWACAKDYSE